MTLPVFMRRLSGDSGSMTGRYDARYTAPELQPLLPVPGHSDAGATTTAIWGALAASFDHYLRDDLHYTSTHLYKQDSGKVFKAWNWSYRSPPTVSAAAWATCRRATSRRRWRGR